MSDQYSKVIWNNTQHSIFENFAMELKDFTTTGKYPPDASQDVKYGLELQLKRLKERNLILKYNIEPRGNLPDGRTPVRQWRDDRYISWMEFHTCRLSRTIYRNKKKVYDNNQNSIFYQFATDVRNAEAVAADLYSCPNCGAVSKIAVLQGGCPFCGTFFEMNELFPKVTNYYFLKDSGYTDKEIKRSIGKVMLPFMAFFSIYYIISFIVNYNPKDAGGVPLTVFLLMMCMIGGAVAGAIIGYFLWAIGKLCSVFTEAGKAIPMLVNSAGSGQRFVSFMSQYSPEFSFEYFSEKVVSMIKMIIYSENASDLPYYEGPPLGSRFLNVIESSYAGAVALKKYEVKGDHCYITVDIYLENLYDNGKRIYSKKDKVRAELRRNIRKPIDINFSIERIQCKSCGASFNAIRMRNCPHCGTRYEIGDDDWIITGFF